MPQNVEALRPRMKAQPLPARTETRVPQANAVHNQVETLAQELNAQVAPPLSPVEEMILGEAQAPMIDEPLPPIPVSIRPTQTMRPAPEPEAPRRGIGRFFGRGEKKPEPQRVEPAQSPRAAAAPRATAQVMTRSTQDPQRAAQTPQTADDLFAGHKKDDQFEIPAFLRRQTN
jgi:cell division protein FtsZ